MPFDLEKVIKSKQRFRQKLAARPIAEKLKMLDDLRERSLTLRAAKTVSTKVLLQNIPSRSKNKSA